MTGIDFKHGHSYYVMITAKNAVGLNSSAISEAINIDDTPPEFGMVIELHSEYRIEYNDDEATVAFNNHMCGSDSGKYYTVAKYEHNAMWKYLFASEVQLCIFITLQ